VAVVTAVGAVYLLYASESKTAIVLALACPLLAIGLYGLQRLSRIPLLVLMALGAATSAALFVIAAQSLDLRGGDILLLLFGDDNFTGRTHVWSFAWSHIADQPLLGHGFRGFWGIGPESPKLRAEIEFIRITGSAHNGFVDNLLDLGAVGLAVCLAYILSIFQAIQRLTVRPGGVTVFYLTVVFFVIGRNMMESVILWSTFFDNLLFVLVGFLAGQDQRLAAQSASASSPNMSRAIPIPGPTDGAVEPVYRHGEVKP
jgi:exopolysaccharide production protein ExoQ